MPLKGIKVLELAGLAPAPFCGAILADFGASVIKIDRVSSSSEADCMTNGKKSLALNLKDNRGRDIFLRLSSKADVLIEPFRRGVMENLGLGPEVLTKLYPKLIYARLTGFGQTGPYSDMAGHDINFLSLSGVLSFLGRAEEKPVPPVNLLADFGGGGLTCALGIVLALLERSNSGKGQVIDCSMVEGAAYLSSWLFRSQNLPIWGQKRGQNVLDTGTHFYETYETADGRFVSVGALESQFYDILVQKLKLPELESQWSDFESKKKVLAKVFKTKTRDEWCEIFDFTDACVTPVLDVTEVTEHAHNKERETFIKLGQGVVAPKPAPRLSRTTGISKANLPAVENGEHSEEILREIGYSSFEIHEFEKEGVIKSTKLSKL
ncbi:hypothetical protein RUM43_008518 [Polyplax serrata]|uniref:Alpha-methylacyl-CoA racemase n=1 Tax=Polyplax serrata TaxID=468196 RepID=A0AAN8NN45_POLSC